MGFANILLTNLNVGLWKASMFVPTESLIEGKGRSLLRTRYHVRINVHCHDNTAVAQSLLGYLWVNTVVGR